MEKNITYQVFWTDGGNFAGNPPGMHAESMNVAVYQRNRDVHDLAMTAKKIVVESVARERKAKKSLTFMQIFFHYNKPKRGEELNGEHRFTWSGWDGVKLEY